LRYAILEQLHAVDVSLLPQVRAPGEVLLYRSQQEFPAAHLGPFELAEESGSHRCSNDCVGVSEDKRRISTTEDEAEIVGLVLGQDS